jgi:cell surface protein SprA
MNVDWNTLNQFEFNNRFKVGFDGYDDDIIKKVEFGNVNLETQSSLIGGGQTLFGVRADFQFGPLFLKTIASQRRAERRFINARGGASRQQFSIRAYDYAKNHFFLDTAYFAVWRAYHRSVTPVLPIEGSSLVVKGDIEVWESTTDLKELLPLQICNPLSTLRASGTVLRFETKRSRPVSSRGDDSYG